MKPRAHRAQEISRKPFAWPTAVTLFRSSPPNPIPVKSKRVESLDIFNFVNIKPEESYKSAEGNRRESKRSVRRRAESRQRHSQHRYKKRRIWEKQEVCVKTAKNFLEVSVYKEDVSRHRDSEWKRETPSRVNTATRVTCRFWRKPFRRKSRGKNH